MLTNHRLAAAAAAFIVGILTSVACSASSTDLCVDRKVRCETPLSCDPLDGTCKCGGRGGIACAVGFACDPVANTCLSTLCAGIDCSNQPGTSCDRFTGTCKCGGTGGVECAAQDVCNANAKSCTPALNCNQIACPKDQRCEQSTGRCKCGPDECTTAQTCSVDTDERRLCVNSACTGVTCTGANVCDSADGYCKCNGAVCQSGEACACPAGTDGGCAATQRSCRSGNACTDNSTCAARGASCDPVDGLCRCGGPGGPVCASNQLCNLGPPAQCQGGQQCTLPDGGAKSCAGGTSCDPEDGRCKCGGGGGVVCAPAGGSDGGLEPAEICIQNPQQRACRRPCDVRNPDCPTGTYCFFDSSATTPAAYCSVPTDNRLDEAACTEATACFSTSQGARSLHCLGLVLGQTGICHAYCDVAVGSAGCTQVPRAQTCVQIPSAPANYGYCNPN